MAKDPKGPKGPIPPAPDSEEIDETTEAMDEAGKATKSFTEHMGDAKDATVGLGNSAVGFISQFTGGMDLSISGIIAFALEIDNTRAAMDKATGAAGGLNKGVREMRQHVKGLGANYAFLTEAMTATYEGMSAFSNLSSEVQGRMAGLAAGLTRVGVDAGTTAKNFDIMNKGLGLSVEQTEEMTKSIMRTAIGLGTTPKKMAADFAASAPILARYGKNTEGVFRKLAAQSKATGAEMSSLLGVAGKFDTFEDAAGTTAQLNALLGTQLNSVDMLTASEGERIEMMKQSIESSGKSWESMDRFERKALAGAVGMTDLAEAGKIFGTSLEDMEDAEAAADPALTAQEELNKAMKKGTSMTEAWKAMLEGIMSKLSNAVMPLVMEFMNWLVTPGEIDKSPLGQAVDHIVDFALWVRDVAKWWMESDSVIVKSIKKWAAIFLGVAIAAGPILTFLGSMKMIVMGLFTILKAFIIPAFKILVWVVANLLWPIVVVAFKVIMFAIGALLSPIGLVVAAIVGIIAIVWIFKEEIAAALIVAWNWWKNLATGMTDAFGDAMDWIFEKLGAFGSFMLNAFTSLGDGLRLVFQGIGNFFVGMLNDWIIKPLNGLIGWAYDLITNLPDWAVPDVFQNASREDFLIEPFERFHDGTQGRPMLGPAIVEDNETVILPSKNSAGGTVLTANDMANAGTGNQPVTVVINIDGREFVRQTVIPVLNKEFSLQGI